MIAETNKSNWMTDEEYRLVTEKTPIPTIDLVILRESKEGWEVLVIVRKTGYESGKLCIIGGRQWKGETASETIDRQAGELGVKVKVISPFEPNFPAWVDDNPLQDETKHSCTNVYPVRITGGEVKESGQEYSSFKWLNVAELPDMAYDHKFEILKAVEQLNKFGEK